MDPNPFETILKIVARTQQNRQEELAIQELEVRNAAYNETLAKLADEEKELEVHCATAKENMAKAVKWFNEYKAQKPALVDIVEKTEKEMVESIERLERFCIAECVEAQADVSNELERYLARLKLENEQSAKDERNHQAELAALEKQDADISEQLRLHAAIGAIRSSVDTLTKKADCVPKPVIKTEVKEEQVELPDTQFFEASTSILSQVLLGAPQPNIDDKKAMTNKVTDFRATQKAALRKRNAKSAELPHGRLFVDSTFDDAKHEVAKAEVPGKKMNYDADGGAAKCSRIENVVKCGVRKRNAKSEDMRKIAKFIDSTWASVKPEPQQEAEEKMNSDAVPSTSRQMKDANRTENPHKKTIKKESDMSTIFF